MLFFLYKHQNNLDLHRSLWQNTHVRGNLAAAVINCGCNKSVYPCCLWWLFATQASEKWGWWWQWTLTLKLWQTVWNQLTKCDFFSYILLVLTSPACFFTSIIYGEFQCDVHRALVQLWQTDRCGSCSMCDPTVTVSKKKWAAVVKR